jgi:hypothetical protein
VCIPSEREGQCKTERARIIDRVGVGVIDE